MMAAVGALRRSDPRRSKQGSACLAHTGTATQQRPESLCISFMPSAASAREHMHEIACFLRTVTEIQLWQMCTVCLVTVGAICELVKCREQAS